MPTSPTTPYQKMNLSDKEIEVDKVVLLQKRDFREDRVS